MKTSNSINLWLILSLFGVKSVVYHQFLVSIYIIDKLYILYRMSTNLRKYINPEWDLEILVQEPVD